MDIDPSPAPPAFVNPTSSPLRIPTDTSWRRLALTASLSSDITAADELWLIEARRALMVLDWLIRLAEHLAERFDRDSNAWEAVCIRIATIHARAELVKLGAMPEAANASIFVEGVIARLANTIAEQAGAPACVVWSAAALASLARPTGEV